MGDSMTWHTINCRCTRFYWQSGYYHMTIRGNCPVCKGQGWLLIPDRDIWKRNGISMA